MKIVYISSSTIPSRAANSIHVMNMCQALTRNGHEVILLAPDKKDDVEPGIVDIFSFYGVKKCFEVVKLPWFPIKGRGYIYGFLAGKQTKAFSPDLVYCRNIPGCFFAAKLSLPVIFESHAPAIDSGVISEKMFRGLIRDTHLRQIVVITHTLKKYYEINYPGTKGTIQVAPDGADPFPEGLLPIDLPNRGRRLQVGYVGHLYKGKGIEIVSQLASHCPWIDFHVVGGTVKDIQLWRDNHLFVNNLIYHGYAPHSDIASYLIAFDVLLLPNKSSVKAHGNGKQDIGKWTSPLKAFEYMAAKKPIIASDLPVLREIFEDGQNALLCHPDDIDGWKDALMRISVDDELGERLSAAAFSRFLKSYTWQSRAANIIGG